MSNEAEDFFSNFQNSGVVNDNEQQVVEESSDNNSSELVPSSSFSKTLRSWRQSSLETSTSPDESEGEDNSDTAEVENEIVLESPHDSSSTIQLDSDLTDSLTITYYSRSERTPPQAQHRTGTDNNNNEDDNITFTYYSKKPPLPVSQPPSSYSSNPYLPRGNARYYGSPNDSHDNIEETSDQLEEDQEQKEEEQPDSLTVTYYAKKSTPALPPLHHHYTPPHQQQQQQYQHSTRQQQNQQQLEQLKNSHSSSTDCGDYVRRVSEISHSSSIDAYRVYEEEQEEGVYGYGGGRGDEEEVDFSAGAKGTRDEEQEEDTFDYSSYYDDYQFDEEEEQEDLEEQEEEQEDLEEQQEVEVEVYEEDAYIEEKMEEKDFDSPMPARTKNNNRAATASPKKKKSEVPKLQPLKSFKRVDVTPARKNIDDSTATTPAAVGGKNQDYLALARQYRLERPYQDPGYKAVCVLCQAALCADVFFPCQHRCVCRGCIKKENICDERAMLNNPSGYCMCSLCASVIKLILPNEGGEEVEKYWRWVYEEPVELPPHFLRDFKHSEGVIRAVYMEDDKTKGAKKDGDCSVS